MPIDLEWRRCYGMLTEGQILVTFLANPLVGPSNREQRDTNPRNDHELGQFGSAIAR